MSNTFRIGDNSEDYSLGSRTQFDAWLVREWSGRVSSTFRVHGESWGNIDGADPDLNPGMVPTADPARRGGKRLNLGLGTNIYMSEGTMAGNRLVLEFSFPIYQSLDGPQLQTDFEFNVGWQLVF